MITLKIYNNTKTIFDSFQCELDVDGNRDVSLFAYGDSEKSCIIHMKKLVNKLVQDLQQIDYSKIEYVDWRGRKI
jgi:hypothetical protein